MFWLIADKTLFVIFVYSIAIGAEVAFKSMTLWLFGLTYLKSSLEMPKVIKSKDGVLSVNFVRRDDQEAFDRKFKTAELIGLVCICLLWVDITVSQFLFD